MNFKLVTPGYYSIVVTTPTPDYAERLVVEMVKKGYSVAPGMGDSQLHMTPENAAASVIALAVYSGKPDLTLQQVYDDVVEIVQNHLIGIYSMAVSEFVPCLFGSTNILLPKKPQPPVPPLPPPIPPDTLKKMN